MTKLSTPRFLGHGLALSLCALSGEAVADKTAPAPAASTVTADFTMPDPACTATSMSITAKLTSHGPAFDGRLFSTPTDSAAGYPVHVDASGTGSVTSKTGFACERSPLRHSFEAVVKTDAGATVASKTFHLAKLVYPELSARPPSAGSDVKNVLFVTGVVAEQMTCGQPIVVTFSGVSKMVDTYITPRFTVDLTITGAPERNAHSTLQQRIDKGASFVARVQGPTLDCAFATPIVQPTVTLSGTTIPVQGAIASAPSMHASSTVWSP